MRRKASAFLHFPDSFFYFAPKAFPFPSSSSDVAFPSYWAAVLRSRFPPSGLSPLFFSCRLPSAASLCFCWVNEKATCSTWQPDRQAPLFSSSFSVAPSPQLSSWLSVSRGPLSRPFPSLLPPPPPSLLSFLSGGLLAALSLAVCVAAPWPQRTEEACFSLSPLRHHSTHTSLPCC